MGGTRRKILIVDDDELNLDLLEEVLAVRYEVRRETSGEAALAALREFPAEVVLLDIVMPGLDGYETCRRIVADPVSRRAKVILLSGKGSTQERVSGYAVGASDYLVKPFDADELVAKVGVFLALRSAQDESRAKSEFIANVSHEIRTPMTAILGYSENLRDANLAENARQEAIDAIWRNGRHLLELINNILDLSKIEASMFDVERHECNPLEIVGEVFEMMRARAEGRRLELAAECHTPIPVRIRSDRTRIKQILVNLVGNALKFTEHGSIRIGLELRAAAAEPLLQITVTDTGIGIAPDKLATLCEPFVQADTSVTRRFGGSGLGLSISRRLARLLGGELSFTSEPGRGSTFAVTIGTGSLDGVAMSREIPSARLRRVAATEGRAPSPRIPYRILLAEDGPDNQRLLSFVLQKAGAEVTIAANGRLAVDAVLAAERDARPFDVVLMDMQMPVLDGYSATALLREAGCKLPIVGVTAHAMAEDKQRCLDMGCDRFASKPIDRDALIAVVHELASRGR